MRIQSMDSQKKEEMLSKCFEYFVEHGLENVTMRKLCEQTGIAISSAYYWFGNKDNMLIQATEWGLKHVTDKLFSFIYKYIDNLECVILTFPEYVMKYKEQVRFIYQLATSKKYGGDMRPTANKLIQLYDNYNSRIAGCFECDDKELQPYVYLFVSAVLDYVIWNDKEKLEIEIACIFRSISNLIRKDCKEAR